MKSSIPQKKSARSLAAKRKGQRHQCAVCGDRFLSLLELLAHKRKYRGPHPRPQAQAGPSETIVEKIEDLRAQQYRGSRETNRSS